MSILIIGLLLFSIVHFIPVFAGSFGQQISAKIGDKPYKGLFTLFILISLVLIYLGWTSIDPILLYETPIWAFHIAPIFILLGFILFVASGAPTNLKKIVRHPQLTGVLFWAFGHLLANAEDRSVILFGGFAIWAIATILGCNRRDAEWKKPERQPIIKDILTVIIGLAAYIAFFFAHELVIGVSPGP